MVLGACFSLSTANAEEQMNLTYSNGKVYNLKSEFATTAMPASLIDGQLYNHSPLLYAQYKQGLAMRNSGIACLTVGVTSTVAGLIMVPLGYCYRGFPVHGGISFMQEQVRMAGWGLLGAGVALTSAGIPLYTIGIGKVKSSLDTYNSSSLSLLLKDNGIGLRFNL